MKLEEEIITALKKDENLYTVEIKMCIRDRPKGVLIVGIPGCGKSLNAKAIANLFEAPLLRMDMGRLMGKYVGESEANMRKAILMAESISPLSLIHI